MFRALQYLSSVISLAALFITMVIWIDNPHSWLPVYFIGLSIIAMKSTCNLEFENNFAAWLKKSVK